MGFIKKQEVVNWVGEILENYHVFGPVLKDDVLIYGEVEESKDIVWDFEKPVNSIKEAFFPRSEILLEMKIDRHGENALVEKIPKGKSVLFNIRPCDVHGILTLDAMFLHDNPQDQYYASRRDNSVIVGLACTEMGETCFCTSVGGGPANSDGMDVMLTPIENGLLVDILTAKGKALFSDLPLIEIEYERNSPTNGPAYQIPDEERLTNSFDAQLWADQAERCISCRICAYVCPTCRCFDIRDEIVGNSNGMRVANRIRCWDSCASETYRRIAGGHNPRASKSDRLRNRILCKLFYYPQQYGSFACVGCGKCIEACPVGIDITEILSVLIEEVS